MWTRQLTAIAVAGALVALSISSATALDRRVQINNITDYDIVQFYASNKGTNDWEEDILGRDILPAGHTASLSISTTAPVTANSISWPYSRMMTR